MKPFGWGWTKGTVPATRITVNYIVSVADMVHVLTVYAWENMREWPLEGTLRPFEVEQIIRRAYAASGDGIVYADLTERLTADQYETALKWAQSQIRTIFPEQYEASRKKGWL